MGRRQEQRAARKAAAPTVAEHPVFDAPERAEDAADAYDKNALDEHAGMCDEGATSVENPTYLYDKTDPSAVKVDLLRFD